MFPRSGHAINLEEPVMFNRLLDDFFHQVESGRWAPRDPGGERGAERQGGQEVFHKPPNAVPQWQHSISGAARPTRRTSSTIPGFALRRSPRFARTPQGSAAQRPLKTGSRFSTNARAASRWSSVWPQWM